MEKVLEAIRKNKLMLRGETIGIGVSGGADSMALLHYLNSIKEDLDIDIVAITVDHGLRENADSDCDFVMNYCRENRIRCHKFKVDSNKIAKERGLSIEQAAREARYGVFDALIKKGIVDKIALAHHMGDQAETILLHILRGAGLVGAGGMEYVRDGVYIRPFLNVTKDEIIKYNYENGIENVEDETNADSTFSRNYLRNKIMPLLRKKFPAVDQNLVNFGKACKEDDDFISKQANFDAIITEPTTVKIPLNYFIYPASLTSRMVMKAFDSLGVVADIERKHIKMVIDLAKAENGKKIDLPHKTTAIKEYEYITLVHKEKKVITDSYSMKVGKVKFANMYEIDVKRTKMFMLRPGIQLMDVKKIPTGAAWRVRQKGDKFEKFGGGTKPLRTYLIDKKIPARLRDSLPVLAKDDEVYCILGVEISNKVKVDETTKMAYQVTYKEIKEEK